MGQLVFQATLGGQVALVGPNTASTININIPATNGNMVTTGDTGTVTSTMLASSLNLTTPNIGVATGTSLKTTGGLYTTGAYGGSYTDGIVVDYATGLGRISVGTSDGLAFYNAGVATTELMRLDSSGNLGIGTSSPSAKLQVSKAGGVVGSSNLVYVDVTSSYGGVTINASSGNNAFLELYQSGTTKIGGFGVNSGTSVDIGSYASGYATRFYSAGNLNMTLDSSGNLGLGVTPSAFSYSTYKSLEVGGAGSAIFAGANDLFLSCSAYYNSGWKYSSTSNAATTYEMTGGQHKWYNAPSGTAGNAISFTQAMTLDASGNLLVGASSGTGNSERFYVTASVNGYLNRFYNSNAAPFGMYVYYSGATPNSTSSEFLRCDDSTATRASIRSNGGLANYSANNVNLSDERTKTDIVDAGNYLDKICAIPVRTFKYKDQTDDLLNLGVIAQEVEKVAPELVDASGFGETPEDGIPLKAIYQTDLQYALMKCIQEQQAIIQSLTARLDKAGL